MINITFKPLAFSDIPIMHQWFNKPHVQAFYSLRQWIEQEVLEKLKPYILSDNPVNGFIILINQQPIGYVQYYNVKDYPWNNQNLSEDIIEHAAGMDLFIGEERFIGKGLGGEIIKNFLDAMIWPQFQYCIVDPDVNNTAAIRCYEKLHFKEHAIIEAENALKYVTRLKLMIRNRK